MSSFGILGNQNDIRFTIKMVGDDEKVCQAIGTMHQDEITNLPQDQFEETVRIYAKALAETFIDELKLQGKLKA